MKAPVNIDSTNNGSRQQSISSSEIQIYSSNDLIIRSVRESEGTRWLFLLIMDGFCVFHLKTINTRYSTGLLAVPPEAKDMTATLSDNFRGWLLCMPPSIVQINWKGERFANLSKDDADAMVSYYGMLANSLDNSYFTKELYYLCHSFISSCSRQFNVMDHSENSSRIHETVSEFSRLVEQYAHRERALGFYAVRLNLSVKYLSAVIISATNTNASKLIYERAIEYAKDLLLNTNMRIREISQSMNFKSTSEFCKYFKKRTGICPSDFRLWGQKAINVNKQQ